MYFDQLVNFLGNRFFQYDTDSSSFVFDEKRPTQPTAANSSWTSSSRPNLTAKSELILPFSRSLLNGLPLLAASTTANKRNRSQFVVYLLNFPFCSSLWRKESRQVSLVSRNSCKYRLLVAFISEQTHFDDQYVEPSARCKQMETMRCSDNAQKVCPTTHISSSNAQNRKSLKVASQSINLYIASLTAP